MTATSVRPTRRALVRGAAWSVPVVSIAAAAPAFAASVCKAATTAAATTWQTNSTADSNSYLTQSGSRTGAANYVNVTSVYTGAAGGLSTTRNMASYSVNSTNDSFELSNVIPASNTSNIENNYQTATFRFPTNVASVTFTIEDIDSTTTSTAFYDRVAVIPEAGTTASGTFNAGTALTGVGKVGNPWRTSAANDSRGYDAAQAVNVTVTGGGSGLSSFTIRYWTSVGAQTANSQMWIRIRNMQVKPCV